MEQKKIDLTSRLEKEKNQQDLNQRSLLGVINDANLNLDNISKRQGGAQVLERPSNLPANGKPPVYKAVDFGKLVTDLHHGMCKIWKKLEDAKIIKKEGEIQNKDPLDILNVSFTFFYFGSRSRSWHSSRSRRSTWWRARAKWDG